MTVPTSCFDFLFVLYPGCQKFFFCGDGTIVTGEAEDVDRGFAAHNRHFATEKILWHPGYLLCCFFFIIRLI